MLVTITCLMFAVTVPVTAATNLSVDNITTFKSWMEKDGDVNITLTKNLKGRIGIESSSGDQSFDFVHYWCVLGKGKKTIDLNGHDLKVSYDEASLRDSTLFQINAGTSLTIKDSSQKKEGWMNYDGRIYSGGDTKRHIVENNGGTLTVNSGTLEAGRSRKDNLGIHFGFKNAWRQVNGFALVQKSGTTTINGGLLQGRGYIYKENYGLFSAAAAVHADGGTLIINDGCFYGKGQADVLQIGSNVNISIKAGIFHPSRQDLPVATYFDGLNVTRHYETGVAGVPVRATTKNCQIFKGKKLLNETQIADGAADKAREKINILPTSNKTTLKCVADPNGNPPVLNPKTAKQLVFETKGTQRFKDTAAITGGYYALTYDYTVYSYNAATGYSVLGTLKNASSIADLSTIPGLTDKMLNDNLYLVRGSAVETYIGVQTYRIERSATMWVRAVNQDPVEILSSPTPQIASKKGANVTLTAKAKNATEAWWVRSGPEGSKRFECTSFNNGVATLTVPVNDVASFYCMFKNQRGSKKSAEAEVNYMPTFENGNQIQYITGYVGENLYITAVDNLQSYGSTISRKWYKNGTLISANNHYAFYGDSLCIGKVNTSDAGTYVCKITVTAGNVQNTISSGEFRVTISSGTPPGYITSLDITGIGDLYLGDKAPTVNDLKLNDPRAKITNIEWTGVNSSGILISHNPSYKITVVVSDFGKYSFKYNSNKEFPWTIDGKKRTDFNAPNNANLTTKGLILSYTYGNYTPLTSPHDSVSFQKTNYEVTQGEKVNIQLQYSVNCPKQHTTKHTVTKMEVRKSMPLPAGLTMDSLGRITGTVKQQEASDTYSAQIVTTFSSGETWGTILFFRILPAKESVSPPTSELPSSGHTKHKFSAWKDNGAGAHTHTCSECGVTESEPHEWDDGTVTKKATPSANGVVTYVCKVCGAKKTQVLLYESGYSGDAEVEAVKVLINAIGTVTLNSGEILQKAREGYNHLSAEQKKLVDNIKVLEAAEKAYADLQNKAAADKVKKLISSIGTVTVNSGDAIQKARDAYNKLTANQKKLVDNIKVLEAAEKAYADLKNKAAADKAAADKVKNLIGSIGTVTGDSGEAIQKARDAYNKLTAEQQKLVDNIKVLEAAEKAYNELKNSALPTPDKVKELIEAIGTVTGDSGEAIQKAREAYDKLTEDQKKLVDNESVLKAAEDTYTELQKDKRNPFTDVQEGRFYYDAVLWAVEKNITKGTTATTFSPDATCTRGQVVTFLWRAAGSPEPTSDQNPFSDVRIGAYYDKAVLWAVEKDITKGTTATTFSPDSGCTRGQVVTFLHRFEKMPSPGSTENPFADVSPDRFYYEAVLWAVEKGVTNGTTPTTFSPETVCTRAQIVTFLYRDLK